MTSSASRIATIQELMQDVDITNSDCDEKTLLNSKRKEDFNTIKIDLVNIIRDIKFDTKLLERLQDISKQTGESIKLKKKIEKNIYEAKLLHSKLLLIESKNKQVSRSFITLKQINEKSIDDWSMIFCK